MVVVVKKTDRAIDWGCDVSFSLLGIYETVADADEMVAKAYPEYEADTASYEFRYSYHFVDDEDVDTYISISFVNVEPNTATEVDIGGGYYQE